MEIWARYIDPSGQPGPDYWNYFAQRLAEQASIPAGAAVLDVGAYDGNVLFKAMQIAGVRGRGVGIDIDSDGFQDGIAELTRRGWGNVAFAEMDANALGFPAETFDIVLANFVGWDDCFDFERMQFTAHNDKTAEVLRVLKPGGQVGLGAWVEQTDIDWLVAAFRSYLPERVKSLGERIVSYGKENPEGYELILRQAGFEDIRLHVETTAFVLPDAEAWWRSMQQAAREYFKQAPDPLELERFKERVFADLEPFRFPDGIHFSKTVSYAFGARPGGAAKQRAPRRNIRG